MNDQLHLFHTNVNYLMSEFEQRKKMNNARSNSAVSL